MANRNPFTVTPLGGYGPAVQGGLQGLGAVLGARREAQQQQQQRTELLEAYRSQDPNQVAEVALRYPEQAQSLMEAINFRDERARQEGGSFAREVLTASPERRNELYERRIRSLQARGLDPTETIRSYQDFVNDPEGELREMESFFAAADPEGFKAFRRDFQMGTGPLAGYRFDPATGDYTISPELKAELQADAQRKATKAGMLTPKDVAGVNDKVTNLTKGVREIQASAKSLEALEGRGSAASKLAAVFKFMKALDPTSVVRESEQGLVYSAEGAARNIAGMLNSLMGEGRLTETGFKDIVDTAQTLANSAIDSSAVEVGDYLDVLQDKMSAADLEKLRARVPERFEAQVTPQEGQTATNPQTKERMIFTNGQWQPAP